MSASHTGRGEAGGVAVQREEGRFISTTATMTILLPRGPGRNAHEARLAFARPRSGKTRLFHCASDKVVKTCAVKQPQGFRG